MKTVHRLTPGGQATSLVILFHGYGADGADLIDLGHSWRGVLPNTLFVAPNAPTPCEMGGSGFQWWSLSNGISAQFGAAELERMQPTLAAFIESERAAAGVPVGRVALVGFSQGCMLSLHMAFRTAGIAAVVGYSGCLLPSTATTTNNAPVLLVHGLIDPVVPYAWMEPTATALRQHGVSVDTVTRPMLGHSIDVEGLMAGGTFLAKHLA